MTIQDQVVLALTCWRENRSGGIEGMQSVANVILNRVNREQTCAWTECLRRDQFSSMTTKGDPELNLWPAQNDPQWLEALGLAQQAAASTLEDITGGADLYYAPAGIRTSKTIQLPGGKTIPFPQTWDTDAVTYTTTIQDQVFFREG